MENREKIPVTEITVIDGDSLEVTLPSGQRRQVRLASIDAPEHGQRHSEHARNHLNNIVGSSAYIYVHETDQYGRLVAEVYNEHGRKESLNLRMIREGLAYYSPYSLELEGGYEAEEAAKSESRGVHSNNSQHVEPSTFRKRSREQHQAKAKERQERDEQRRLDWIMEEARARTDKK